MRTLFCCCLDVFASLYVFGIFLASSKKVAVYRFYLKIPENNATPIHRFTWKEIMKAIGKVNVESLADVIGQDAFWVLVRTVIEVTGYSDNAIRAKKQRGEWKEGVHWRKAPDNRLVFNLVAIKLWMAGQNA